jgi:hypothetical protein
MSKWVCRGRKVVETVGRWVVWTRKEGTWKGELVGSGGRRGGRTSLLTRRLLGKEEKGREGWLFRPCDSANHAASLIYTLLHAPSCTQSAINYCLAIVLWALGSWIN